MGVEIIVEVMLMVERNRKNLRKVWVKGRTKSGKISLSVFYCLPYAVLDLILLTTT